MDFRFDIEGRHGQILWGCIVVFVVIVVLLAAYGLADLLHDLEVGH